jgi:phage-related protein
MQASGAIGDLKKTIDSYANQSRIMAEAWKELISYAGILLTYLIQESGIITYLSATIMYITDFLKEIVNDVEAIQSFGGDIFGGVTDSAENAVNATEELKGKLLDFDKFRALDESNETEVAIDQKLIDALSQYQTIMSSVTNSARELADLWKKTKPNNAFIRIFEAIYDVVDFVVNDARLNAFFDGLSKDIQPLIDFLMGDVLDTIVELLKNVFSFISSAYPIIKPLFQIFVGIFEVIESIISLISNAFDILSRWGVLWEIIGGVLGFVSDVAYTLLSVISAVIDSISAIITFDWGKLGDIWSNFGKNVAGAWTNGSGSAIKFGWYADGGLPDKGTMFVAGEAGAEIVYNTSSGQSGVANIQQIKQAMLGALLEYGRTQGSSGQPIEVYLDGEKVYQNTTRHAKQRGQVWGTV